MTVLVFILRLRAFIRNKPNAFWEQEYFMKKTVMIALLAVAPLLASTSFAKGFHECGKSTHGFGDEQNTLINTFVEEFMFYPVCYYSGIGDNGIQINAYETKVGANFTLSFSGVATATLLTNHNSSVNFCEVSLQNQALVLRPSSSNPACQSVVQKLHVQNPGRYQAITKILNGLVNTYTLTQTKDKPQNSIDLYATTKVQDATKIPYAITDYRDLKTKIQDDIRTYSSSFYRF